jgi:hypothetical protein
MTKTLETRFEIASWDEKPYREFPDGRKFARADIVLKGSSGDLAADATCEAVMYYAADGTNTYASLMHVTGTLDGRAGSFVLEGCGTYDGTTARLVSTVVEGSGTDGLVGITGRCESVSTHADYPHWPISLTYDLA